MPILDSLISDAREQLQGREDSLRIDNIILGKTLYTMKGADTVFTDMNFCLVLLENAYGFAYFQSDIDYSVSEAVNRPALAVVDNVPLYLKVAITDALYCVLNAAQSEQPSRFTGNLREKARARAQRLLEEVPEGSKVLLLGAAAEIIEEAQRKGCLLTVFDLEKQKEGVQIGSTVIESSGESALREEITQAEYVIATGMIFVSDTADLVFELAKTHGAKLILYMETGSNFGPQLLAHGAATVLSEFFPYYDFYGETRYVISSSNRE